MATSLKVLILEDRPADAALMVHELRQAGFDPMWRRVETEADYLAHLHADLDVILADYALPQFDALRALQLLQEGGWDTPFLIVSGNIGEELAVSAMKQGAADYLLKDRLARLGPAVARSLQEVAGRRARQQAEEALRASEARFRTMADAAPVLLWLAGLDMGCTFFNQSWLEFTGRTLEQELGFGWADNIHPDDYDRCLAIYRTAFVARQPFEVEYRLRRADGVYRWVLDRGVPLVTAAGHFTGYLGSAIDITTRKEAEQILQQTQEELERRVQERTAALHQEIAERQRLERQTARAQHFALLGRLAAGVSHEIRNPLGVVRLYVDLLEEELRQPSPKSAAEIAQAFTEIKTNLARLDDLVQDYLSLVRVSNIQREPVALHTLVAQFAREMTAALTARGITLHLDGLVSLGTVALHQNTFRRALLNLVHNAMEAMPRGGKLTLRGRRNATTVQLDVSDTGSGIPPEQCARIFEPLYTTKPGGTGLGLFIVYEIVVAHGGQVTVQSTVGHGTTFTITLPPAGASEVP
jgi:PAS domain S-box-containing protein